jgi:hypothetical protein
MAVREQDRGKSEGRPVIGRIGVATSILRRGGAMKAIFAVLLLLNGNASSEELSCPNSYPDNPIGLPRSPGQTGAGLVRTGAFSNAYLYAGKLHSDPSGFEAMVGTAQRKRVKGGWDTEYRFAPSETKWLVCAYGGNELQNAKASMQGRIELWEPIPAGAIRCVLRIREVKQPYQLPSAWTASAACRRD